MIDPNNLPWSFGVYLFQIQRVAHLEGTEHEADAKAHLDQIRAQLLAALGHYEFNNWVVKLGRPELQELEPLINPENLPWSFEMYLYEVEYVAQYAKKEHDKYSVVKAQNFLERIRNELLAAVGNDGFNDWVVKLGRPDLQIKTSSD